MKALISCLCPTMNNPDIVKNAIDCFNDQTYVNKELILITDEKNPYLNALKMFVVDNIKLFIAPHGSTMGVLRNMSLDNANGEYIATWDDDDISSKHRIQTQYNALEESKKKVCYLEKVLVNDKVSNRKGISQPGRFIDPTMLALKSSFPRYNDEANYPIIEDLPIRKHYTKQNEVIFINKPNLYTYVIHENNTCEYGHLKTGIDITI